MSNIIAIDVDGVLVNYRNAYAKRWEQAFGEHPKVKNKDAYRLWDYWDIPFLTRADLLAKLENYSTSDFWRNMPPIQGALEGCQILVDAGYELVAVTACAPRFAPERTANLEDLGYPISKVMCVGSTNSGFSPKAEIINEMKPAYFIDDFIDYFHGIDPDIKKVLINYPVNLPSEKVSTGEMTFIVKDLLEAALVIRGS
jgi:hypothetical protein